jgi:hypothetical protein
MRLVNAIQTLTLLPSAIKHLLRVKRQLKNTSYQNLIQQAYNGSPQNRSIDHIVKSYFWACRLIINCQCLPRSIALYQHLNAAGYKVKHKFGVNKQDGTLKAHAWVEHKNSALNESKKLLDRFDVLDQ